MDGELAPNKASACMRFLGYRLHRALSSLYRSRSMPYAVILILYSRVTVPPHLSAVVAFFTMSHASGDT